jgi:hypothetical protein
MAPPPADYSGCQKTFRLRNAFFVTTLAPLLAAASNLIDAAKLMPICAHKKPAIFSEDHPD